MASLHSISNFGSYGSKHKDSKPKATVRVKPILKKWSQSEKERKSLDLDRGWDEQDEKHQSTLSWGRSSSLSFYDQVAAGSDATTSIAGGGTSGTAGGVGLGVLANTTTTRRYHHSRSISGTSHASGTTSSSTNSVAAPRQFVHPFQQTPHTSTPPLLSYANSLASIADTRDYSPTTITEDEDDNNNITNSVDPTNNHPNHHNHSTGHNSDVCICQTSYHGNPNSLSQPTLISNLPPSQHRSSLDILDTNPLNPASPQAPSRICTSRIASSIPTHSSPLVNISSRSDLCLDRLGDLSAPNLSATTTTYPSSPIGTMSPLRTSLDSGFHRLRAKSDLDTLTRSEHLRAARRKFEIKERAKDEKYAREEIKRRERAENKRAQELEKRLAAEYKEQLARKAREEAAELEEALQRGKHNRKVSIASSGRPSLSIPRPSLSIGRPSTSRKNTTGQASDSEKFMSSSYDNTDAQNPPTHGRAAGTAHAVQFTAPKRKNTAKKKTQGAWTAFILWLRTKLLRMSNH
ncbi:hypothetical protein F5Y14DRAFT_124410 [Nemania sp. NC0429]|nr:hypothetical protein F5Y14DRAFT_124410 [Nemania sp. NC0429]